MDDLIRSMLRHEDGRLFWLSGRRAGQEAGCLRKDGRVVVRVGGRGGPLYLRYRVIWFLVHGEWPSMEIDHINCDPSDDRPENLRVASSTQQKWNRGPTVANRSGAKGVVPYKNGRFTAQICMNGRSTHLGVFETAQMANEAYAAAAASVAGCFARAN